MVRLLELNPQDFGKFFWTLMIFSACFSFLRNRLFSRCSFSISSSAGVFLLFGPRRRPEAWSVPSRRSFLHSVRWDEYSPSCRSSFPIPPETRHWSAFSRIPSLYSFVNVRRTAFAGTSVSRLWVSIVIVVISAIYLLPLQ